MKINGGTLSEGKLLPINCYIYWEELSKKNLTGYYEGFFNVTNKIIVAYKGPEENQDQYGTQMSGDWSIYYIPQGTMAVDSLMVDNESWEKIKNHYNIINLEEDLK